MTTGRVWHDEAAEKKFWGLMQQYEALRSADASGSRGLVALLPAIFRQRRSRERLERIELEARELVERFSTLPAPAETAAREATPTDETHPFLRIAATLANDPGARETRAGSANASTRD